MMPVKPSSSAWRAPVFGWSAFLLLTVFSVGACTTPDDPIVDEEDEEKIESVTPANGTPFGGTKIQVKGVGFAQGDLITLDGAPCESPVFVSATQIDCTTPPSVEGKVTVGLSRQGGEIAFKDDAFEYKCDGVATTTMTVWANEGGNKVAKEDRRAGCSPVAVLNRTWDGTTVKMFGARNEVVSFQLLMEAPNTSMQNITVSFDTLTGPGNSKISSIPATGDGVFSWTNRQIELFYIRYLKIKGLSRISYEFYDERQIPNRFQRPWTGIGIPDMGTDWTDRPDHDKSYPDIAVPLEAMGPFQIPATQSQAIWADIYVPKSATPGVYTGTVTIKQADQVIKTVPVSLTVRTMPALPDEPSSKTMVYMGYEDLGVRFFNNDDMASDPVAGEQLELIRDRFYMMAHRHKISLIDKNLGYDNTVMFDDRPRARQIPRLLDGGSSLFTAANGYDGPGLMKGNGIFTIGIYNSWNWTTPMAAAAPNASRRRSKEELVTANAASTQNEMWTHADAWEQWFRDNSPTTERQLFLIDEPGPEHFDQIRTWTGWLKSNPGVGKNLPSMVAGNLLQFLSATPSLGLDVVASFMAVGDVTAWPAAIQQHLNSGPMHKYFMYNGKRPATGTFATEDEGTSVREIAWGQFKKNVERWFFWESTYYNDFQGGRGQNNLFNVAQTFGDSPVPDSNTGQASNGQPYGNGNGVLFYPGTDKLFPNDSYDLNGPIASLRLKHWRRGIQDIDYVKMALAARPGKAAQIHAIVNRMVPTVLWEGGLTDPQNTGSSRIAPSWSDEADDWEQARAELADIIEGI